MEVGPYAFGVVPSPSSERGIHMTRSGSQSSFVFFLVNVRCAMLKQKPEWKILQRIEAKTRGLEPRPQEESPSLASSARIASSTGLRPAPRSSTVPSSMHRRSCASRRRLRVHAKEHVSERVSRRYDTIRRHGKGAETRRRTGGG